MIIQVLVNLIDNAITNTPAGGTITIKVDSGQWPGVSPMSGSGKTSDNGKTKSAAGIGLQPVATLTVSDTGIGIPPQHLPRIFDRFYRVDTGRARSQGGIGLGLAICQAIVHAHQGTLTATSTPGRGSTFTMTVPVDERVEQASWRAGEQLTNRT
jgi:signal transduction histidine kinase